MITQKINLELFQSRFVKSLARFPAMVSGWATGKTMCGILKGLKLSRDFKENLGVIFRKQYTDLRDSTIKDFESYTGIKPDASREVRLEKSVIMFRHLEEINNLQNINLGWFLIEQGDELDTDKEFTMLRGRLRRKNVDHCGMVIANTRGHNWMWDLWKNKKLEDSELIEAATQENARNLPKDYLADLERLKTENPEIYNQYVLNSWDVAQDSFVVIPSRLINNSINHLLIPSHFEKRITVCDVAGESEDSDETVIYNLVNGRIESEEIYRHRDLMDTVGRILVHVQKHNSSLVCIDKVGEGAGVWARINELYAGSKVDVYGFDGRVSPPEGLMKQTYENYKTYAWFKVSKLFADGVISIPDDRELIKQLSAVSYKYVSNGKIILHSKDDIKKKLGGRSPDRADALVMGLDALDRTTEIEHSKNKIKMSGWMHPRFRVNEHSPMRVYA